MVTWRSGHSGSTFGGGHQAVGPGFGLRSGGHRGRGRGPGRGQGGHHWFVCKQLYGSTLAAYSAAHGETVIAAESRLAAQACLYIGTASVSVCSSGIGCNVSNFCAHSNREVNHTVQPKSKPKAAKGGKRGSAGGKAAAAKAAAAKAAAKAAAAASARDAEDGDGDDDGEGKEVHAVLDKIYDSE